MQITKFKKLNDNKYRVSLKGKTDIILFDDTIIKYNLLANKIINDKKFQEIIDYNNTILGYYKAIKYLKYKMRSQKEITDYLKKENFNKNIIDVTITRLIKDGYINDKKYVDAYILDQINLTLHGPEKIKLYLNQQEICDEYIDERLNRITADIWIERIKKIINKKIKTNKSSKQMFIKKMEQYLYMQGYHKEQYLGVLQDIIIDEKTLFLKDATIIYNKLTKKYQDDKLYYMLKNKLYLKGYDNSVINEYIEQLKKDFY